MKKLLSQLQVQFVHSKIPAINLLNAPIENELFLKDSLVNFWGDKITVSQDLIDLYSWHNGTSFDPEFIKRGYISYELFFNSIDYAINIAAGETFYKFKDNLLMPVFTSFNGEYIALDLNQNREGALFYCGSSDFEVNAITKIFDNLNSFAATILQFYTKDLLILENEMIELDFDKYDEYLDIGLTLNPTSDYWSMKKEWGK